MHSRNWLSNPLRYLLIWLLLGVGLTCAAQAADMLEVEHVAEVSDRVMLDAGAPGETFDSFIVYYRSDAEPGDEEAKAAKEALAVLAKDLDRANARLKLKAKQERRLATGGHLLRLSRALEKSAAEDFMVEMATNPDVEAIEPNTMHQAYAVPNDPGYSSQWGLHEARGGLNIEHAWDFSFGSGVVIAILDTGSSPHPDLDAKTLPGYDFVSDVTSAGDGNGRDNNPSDVGNWRAANECGDGSPSKESNWHGTHVAGIAAALTDNDIGVAGAAPGAYLQHVRVLGKCGGSTADIAEAIIWASGGRVSGVPNNPTPARVLNLSLGGEGPCSTTEQRAIDSARSRNSVLAVAAGNEEEPATRHSPGNCKGVITVGANNRDGKRASYSNYGLWIDVAAPGGDHTGQEDQILSTINSGTRGPLAPTYGWMPGTSMATPYVAGVIALMLERKPSLKPDEVASILRNTARPFPTTCSGGCGSGIVDARAAVRRARGGSYTEFPVSVALYGNGEGKVTSSPSRINCGSSCSARFDKDSRITLRATPVSGYVFDRWSGACSGSEATCTLNMSAAKVTFATFKIPVSPLSNGSVRRDLAVSGDIPKIYRLKVPAGATNLKIQMSGGSGDADLYVQRGVEPTTDDYDCRPYRVGNNETCTFAAPVAGDYYIMLDADPSFHGVQLKVSYSTAPLGGERLARKQAEAGITIPQGGARYYRFIVPSHAADLRIETRGGSGDMDLYVRRSAVPTTSNYDCRPYRNGNNEECVAASPAAGTYYIMLYGASEVSGVSLTATYSPTKTLTVNWAGHGAGTIKVKRVASGEIVATCAAFPCELGLHSNATFELIASATTGSRFAEWTRSQCDSITASGNCRVKMTRHRTATARFTLASATGRVVTLGLSGTGNGSVAIKRASTGEALGTCHDYPCRFWAPVNATYKFTPRPNGTSVFSGWIANQCDNVTATGECHVRIRQPTALTVKFSRK